MRAVAQAIQALSLVVRQPTVRRQTPQSVATSLTVRPSAMTAKIALYLWSATLISLMRGSVTNQPK